MASPDEPASFEQLEALRNVQLVEANEYPLAHVQRAQLRRREDSDDDANVCLCEPPSRFEGEEGGDEARCDDVSCLNFATYVECGDNCPAGKFCRNQRLQRPQDFPRLEPFLTEKKGYGVRTREDIAQANVVGEYVGEIIDQRELARRLKLVPRHELNFYYLLLMPGIYIDARNKGSFTRFVNHSCEPNCKTEKWTVNGETRIAVVALRDIEKGEELTFDYQWKALGSRQIKCYCGAPTCKGVIGTEGDVVKDETSRGFFREPSIEEIGSALIDRRIRIFKSSYEKSVYSIALVKSYDEEKDLYEVEHEILSANSDPTAEMESTIRLKDDGWQLYCDTDGMSEDQKKKEIFSIPKRRVSDFQGTSSVESSPLPPTSTPSPSSNVGSTSNSLTVSPNEAAEQETDPAVPRRREYIVTHQLLVKNIPHKFDEGSLRRLFEERGRDGTPVSDLVSVDMFFFEDRTGWALVDMKTPAAAVASKKKLNNRPLGGNTLRVFTAGPMELDSFRRGKTKVMYLQREGKGIASGDTSTQESDGTAIEAEPVVEPPTQYPYGRRLNWLVASKESPSQTAGISAALEETLRTKFVKVILHIAKRLHLDRGDATSAIIALHRYFTFHPMSVNVEMFAAAMLNLYLKAHCRKVEWKDFVNEVYNEKYGASQDGENTSSLPPDSDRFRAIERQLVAAESELLEGLCFDVSGEYPYLLLEKLTTSKKKNLAPTPSLPPADVQREAKHLIAETLRLRVWTHLPVECVVLSVVYLGAAAVEGVKFLSAPSPKLENLPHIPYYLPQLDSKTNSQEQTMLLECASTICASLQDRWIRLEKSAKPGKETKGASSAEFDTERFAVSREKRVSLKEVIRRLLEAWISSANLPPASPILSSEHTTAGFTTFASLRGIISSTLDDTTEAIAATLVFKKEVVARVPVSGPNGSAGKLLAPVVDRLRTNEIENVESIRKLTYLGSISSAVKCQLAGQKVYLQPWPYREEESTFSETRGIVNAATRELASAITLHAMLPEKFVRLEGIIFPEEQKEQRSDEDDDMVGLLNASSTSISASGSSGVVLDRLNNKKHYLSFEQPLHIYSGIFEAKVSLPLRLRKKVIFDMLTALVSLHGRGYVHRFVAASHLFVYKHGAKLGGYHSVRKTSSVSKDKENAQGSSSNAYILRESERKEHCYGSWLYVAAPEVLLGETQYTWRADMWSAGCVVLSILLDRVPFLQGQDVRVQLDLIFRLCGTPKSSWPEGTNLRLYRSFKPKHDFKMRLRKTLMEQKEKFPEFPEDAIDVLEALLQLDPSKRLSAKKVLGMPFFDEVMQEESRMFGSPDAAFDFSGLPETFPMQKKKLVQHLNAKRRHPPASSTSARAKPGKSSHDSAHSRSNSSSSNHRHRSKRALSMDKSSIEAAERGSRRAKKRGKDASGDVDMDGADDVPLPASFQFSTLSVQEDSSSGGSGGERSKMKSERREKLGWGMGLSSSGGQVDA